jgi:hypothetical protein
MRSQPYHMRPWDEVYGQVYCIEEEDGQCIALIGKIPVVLPQDMTNKLAEAKGKRIGVLRTDTNYRMRILDEPS